MSSRQRATSGSGEHDPPHQHNNLIGCDLMTATWLDWQGTLNQLAGTKNLGVLAAANHYAGTSNLGIIAAMNIKAGNGHDPKGWLDLAAACNKIAGTTNQEALRALQIAAGQHP